MKTKHLLTKTAAVAVCLGAALSCFAQGKDLIKGASKGIFEAPRITRGTVQRFVFPQSAVLNIRTGIADGKLDRAITNATQQAAVNISPKLTLYNKSLITDQSVEKEVLIMTAKERAFYAPEIDAGRMIRQQILDITVLSDEGQAALAQNIHTYIKNHTLQTLLLEELENYDIYNMALDLTDYFSLDKPFEQAAFEYTLRHPHQMNLNMRRLMYNPLVDDAIKNRLKYFLQSEYIEEKDYGQFQMAIHTLHKQYQQRLSAAQKSDVIQAQIQYYQDVTKRLRDFVSHEPYRLPKWNTLNAQERELGDEVEWIMSHDHLNKFPQIYPFRQALQEVYDAAPKPTILSVDETLALFEEFIKTTPLNFPRPLCDIPQEGPVAFAQEETLWDSVVHWYIHDAAAMRHGISRIREQYSK